MNSRYSRQEMFTPIGKEGQIRLKAAHILMIGAGALGTANGEMLARAGVGKLTIVDRDYVEISNLQRQQMYKEKHAYEKWPKAIAIGEELKKINSTIELETYVEEADPTWLEQYLTDETPNLILDATDNFETRLILNDISQKWKIPWIYGACVGATGVSLTIHAGKSPCLYCMLDTLPETNLTCDTVGIISPAAQMVAAFQTTEALKILVNDNNSLRTKLVYFDLWNNQMTQMKIDSLKKEECPSCGADRDYPFLNDENRTKFAVLCGRNTVQIRPPRQLAIELKEVAEQLPSYVEKIKRNEFLLSFSIKKRAFVLFKDGRLFIHGMKDIREAKKLYYQLFS
ncbi:ThiF family adenylyltransferase [Lederbergia lenta]|uniref:Adenylyltransferase ThiF n=1 Tax=Lederbergia lenta TaxID=1467 RepID=A0A2X4W7W9_LEDLE|nr:ThiF family adenylyltransferase [Lederbergia lenta]MEC2325179.1 ThiF family adenylyltransferase [Lederbergia lenta]SQI56068.1 adenylyltransferase ThiF [Lederbergia lenta]